MEIVHLYKAAAVKLLFCIKKHERRRKPCDILPRAPQLTPLPLVLVT